jgi:hypothetical protein
MKKTWLVVVMDDLDFRIREVAFEVKVLNGYVWHTPKLLDALIASPKVKTTKCWNPSLGLVTKASACKGVGQERSPGVPSHALGGVGECEGMNPYIPKELQLWELESQWILESSEIDYRGQNALDWDIPYIIGKFLERRCLKWSHDPFGHVKHKLWPKERPGVKLSIWFPITKSRKSPRFLCM